MVTKKSNLSAYNPDELPSAEKMSIAIIVSEWNGEITESLYNGAVETLVKNGCKKENISRYNVPGSFELITAANHVALEIKPDAVICIGCVIKGETPHFDFISNAVANGIMQLNLKYNIPFIFGVLTTNDMDQARERSGGVHGNKGVEAAISAIKMVALLRQGIK